MKTLRMPVRHTESSCCFKLSPTPCRWRTLQAQTTGTYLACGTAATNSADERLVYKTADLAALRGGVSRGHDYAVSCGPEAVQDVSSSVGVSCWYVPCGQAPMHALTTYRPDSASLPQRLTRSARYCTRCRRGPARGMVRTLPRDTGEIRSPIQRAATPDCLHTSWQRRGADVFSPPKLVSVTQTAATSQVTSSAPRGTSQRPVMGS